VKLPVCTWYFSLFASCLHHFTWRILVSDSISSRDSGPLEYGTIDIVHRTEISQFRLASVLLLLTCRCCDRDAHALFFVNSITHRTAIPDGHVRNRVCPQSKLIHTVRTQFDSDTPNRSAIISDTLYKGSYVPCLFLSNP